LTGNLNYQPTVACYGAQTATANVTNLQGGSPNQSFLWASGSATYTSPSPSLSAGVWSLTVTDNLTACKINEIFMITQPSSLSLSLSRTSPTACAGATIGLSGINSGGTPGYITPYTYTWTNGAVSDGFIASEANAGFYTYTLSSRDSLNCGTSKTISVTFIQNPVLVIPTASICPFETGTLQASGATTYLWFDNSTTNTFTASPLSNTTYSVIGSALGCTTAASAQIVVKPVPTPLFASNSPRCNGETLNLFASGGVAYYWTGPQNFTSTAQSPQLFNSGPNATGQYQFTVSAANGCTAASSGSVVVHPTPTLSAAGSSVCVTHTMTLTSNSDPGTTFQWTGPLSFFSNQQNPSVSNPPVSMSGDYTVTAFSAFNCSNAAVAQVTITAVPVPSFVTNSPVCDQQALTFNSSLTTGGMNFQWNGPDNFISQQLNPGISPAGLQNAGEYTLTVTAGPCISSISKLVIVNSLPQPVIAGPDEVCESGNLVLTVSDPSHQIVSYYWQYPMGGSSQQTIFVDSVKPYNAGVYSATVTDVNGCSAGAQKNISVLVNPTITAVGDTVCLKTGAELKVWGADSYFWTGKNLLSNTGDKVKVISADYVLPQTYVVTGTAVNGCTAVASAQVHTRALPEPSIVVRPKNRLCIGDEVILEGAGGNQFIWITPEGAGYGGQVLPLIIKNVLMGGDYVLTVTDGYGCKNSTITAVKVDAPPDGKLAGQTWDACSPFCSNYEFEPASVNGKTIARFYIDNRLVGIDAFYKCFSTPGQFIITAKLTDSVTGCINTQSYTVNAREKPTADFNWDPVKPVETVDEVRLSNNSAGDAQKKWTWYIEGKERQIDSENASCVFTDAAFYRVAYVVENKWGCADTAVRSIEVFPDFGFYMPDAFTPDGDGKNEVLSAVTRGIKKYQLEVFNRWGERIFLSYDPGTGWDGTFMGKPCKSDVYVWKAAVLTNTDERKEFSGHVLLIK
jgi:gliding motility-associated-like protein